MTLEFGRSSEPPDRSALLERALSRFGLELVSLPIPVTGSVLNENFRVDTNHGPRLVRLVRPSRPAQSLMIEWRAVQWALSRDIPAPLPEVVDGRPFVDLGALRFQVYPWVDGRQAWPEPEDAFEAGEMQGRVHGGMAYFADPALPRGKTGATWDTEESIALLSRVDDLIRYYPAPGDRRLRIQDGLRFKLGLLESDEPRPVSGFASLAVQPCHGDFHGRNLIFGADGEIDAVVDWELVGLLPPLFELVRAVAFSGLLEERLLRPYVSGYRQHRTFSAWEAAAAVEMWWQSLLHQTWTFRRSFIEGDGRVDHFFESDDQLLRRFADQAYRVWLADELSRP
ncbi:MAG TPA: phosphotransferase [Tepidiformaceae bacterium]|nr:phosphotransferase [Tepidiformaceae bacterium]